MENLAMFAGPAIGIVVTIGALLFVARVFASFAKAAQDEQRILATGVPARGQITLLQQTGTYINNNPQVIVVMQVFPQHGQPYQAQVTKVVSLVQLPALQVGRELALKVDPQNPMKVAIAAAAAPAMPAMGQHMAAPIAAPQIGGAPAYQQQY